MTADASAQPADTAEGFRRDYLALVTKALTRYVEEGRDLRLETIRPEGSDEHRANIVFSVDAETFHGLLGEMEEAEWRGDSAD